MTILVLGGAGYIGSHTVMALKQQGYRVVVLDNLVYGHGDVLEPLDVALVQGQVGDRALLEQLIGGHHPATEQAPVQAVLHFAAYAYVGESVERPALYYRNNLAESLTLVEVLLAEGERRGEMIPLVFSSTCATYGVPDPDQIPIQESCPQRPINPYGRSKAMVEQLLADVAKAHGQPSVAFRYFNAAGAHPSALVGEHHEPETHLIPLVLDVISGRRPYLQIYGDDYPTPDGTCIRDYIHVCDLADAHVLGLKQMLERLAPSPTYQVFNLGNGTGYSVQEVIETAKEVTKRGLLAHVAPRREGDPPVLVASAALAMRELGWIPRYPELRTMIEHAWQWHQRRFRV
ncbi:UDP-glucose 4-epimerase GalE [Synechococcus sp. CB0101]|uniref:UDP-glucose 4-epimerase GalE n=1 Tax=Synechococcus sp. CB0101 TaxID=232348 RepID=UPI0002001952|nr:UDP-glucose 4-epimerase GalE [Synechococcus sp. CB0101]QCH14435.1 UDP-glucose 4-epimerase GalE [Synechococcus sp. CB0101]